MSPPLFSKWPFIISLMVYAVRPAWAGNGTCSPTEKCETGCCSREGFCGFGPEFCGDEVCISSCDSVAECGSRTLDYIFAVLLLLTSHSWRICDNQQYRVSSECLLFSIRVGRRNTPLYKLYHHSSNYYGKWTGFVEQLPSSVMLGVKVGVTLSGSRTLYRGSCKVWLLITAWTQIL